MPLLAFALDLLRSRPVLLLVLAINAIGSLYGFYWYGPQLAETAPIYLPFVPDSPTATLFFAIAVLGWLLNRSWKWVEALAFVTLIKYGLWAVAMNLLTLVVSDELSPLGWMLVGSHFLMAVQAVLYAGSYRFSWRHLALTGVWTLHNDVIDYVFGQMPVYSVLTRFAPQIGYFTFWLSIGCLALGALVIQSRTLAERRPNPYN